MPSTRFTKINIDQGVYDLLKTLAAAQGISAAQMLERVIIEYLRHNGDHAETQAPDTPDNAAAGA